MTLQRVSLHNVPPEVFEEIYSYIDATDIKSHASLSRVCGSLRDAMDDDERVKLHMRVAFPSEYSSILKEGIPRGEWTFAYRLHGRMNRLDKKCYEVEEAQEKESERLDAEMADRDEVIGNNAALSWIGTSLGVTVAVVTALTRQ